MRTHARTCGCARCVYTPAAPPYVYVLEYGRRCGRRPVGGVSAQRLSLLVRAWGGARRSLGERPFRILYSASSDDLLFFKALPIVLISIVRSWWRRRLCPQVSALPVLSAEEVEAIIERLPELQGREVCLELRCGGGL